jgi:hypothetical protein
MFTAVVSADNGFERAHRPSLLTLNANEIAVNVLLDIDDSAFTLITTPCIEIKVPADAVQRVVHATDDVCKLIQRTLASEAGD